MNTLRYFRSTCINITVQFHYNTYKNVKLNVSRLKLYIGTVTNRQYGKGTFRKPKLVLGIWFFYKTKIEQISLNIFEWRPRRSATLSVQPKKNDHREVDLHPESLKL